MNLARFFGSRAGFLGPLLLAFACAAQLQRVPNTSPTNLPPAPPQFGYTVNNAFPTVSFPLRPNFFICCNCNNVPGFI